MGTAPITTDSSGRLLFAEREQALSYALARHQLYKRRQRVRMLPRDEREVPGYVWHVSVESPAGAARRLRHELGRAVSTVAGVAKLARA